MAGGATKHHRQILFYFLFDSLKPSLKTTSSYICMRERKRARKKRRRGEEV